MFSLNPFQILLNNLSSELDQRNLQSLIHVCGPKLIPGGQREKINTGWDVFSILLRQNAIGEEPERMKFLLRIIKELRPKRRDLVSMVKRHIEGNYEQPDTILDGMESSSDGHLIPRPSTPSVVDDCCSVRCGCFNCNCNPCCGRCCCCVILAIMFSFFAAAAAVVWYPKTFHLHDYLPSDNKGLSEAGPIVIGLLGFIAACCVLCGVYISIRQRRNELAYSVLRSINDATSVSNQAVHGSYAASDSTRTTCSAYATKFDRPRCSCSSGRITASGSLASMGSSRTPWPMPDSEAVTDGCSQQDVFTHEFEADQEDKDDGLINV